MADNPDKNRSNQDVSPTRSMPGISDFLSDVTVSGKTTESAFEDYEILGELPRGGQAAVYKAVHKATKTKVAIKVLLPSLLAS